jgi:hypothetical protein
LDPVTPYITAFNASGEMIDFEVMIRPMKALPAVIEAMGNRIDSPMAKRKAAATATGRPHPCYNDAF